MSQYDDSQATDTQSGSEAKPVELVSVANLKKHFAVDAGVVSRFLGSQEHVKAVDGVDLTIRRGETVGVIGESGSGKSTLARTIARLQEPTDGSIRFDGEHIETRSESALKPLRRRVQYVFQDPLSALNPRKTVGESVRKPLDVHDIDDPDERWDRVESLFDEVGLSPGDVDAYPHELSGGQQQRVGICRALILEPELVIFDEPVSALDVTLQAQILNLINKFQRELDLTCLIISHDLDVVRHVCDRLAVMYAGEIVEKGPTSDLFADPYHPYTRALVQAIPSIDTDASRDHELLTEETPSAINPPNGCRFHPRCPEFIDGNCIKSNPTLETVANEPNRMVACHWQDRSRSVRENHTPPSESERAVIKRELDN